MIEDRLRRLIDDGYALLKSDGPGEAMSLFCAAQEAGAVRQDIGVREVKAILVGCQAMEAYNSALAERVTDVVVDGLRVAR